MCYYDYTLMMIDVYVDDSILLSIKNENLMENIKKYHSKEFEMMYLKSFHFCLKMEILYDKELRILSIN